MTKTFNNIANFAGAWNMSDKEAKKIEIDLKKAWNSWRPVSDID